MDRYSNERGRTQWKMPVKLQTSGRVTDLWSGQIYTRTGDSVEVNLQPHEGTVLVVR